MKRAYCLLNHALTERQTAELRTRYGAGDVAYPSAALSAAWAQIPAEREMCGEVVDDVIAWLSGAEKGDLLIIQGEFGHTFLLTDYALKAGLVPLHAVTRRVAREEREGEIVRRSYVFEHVCFREYTYFSEMKQGKWRQYT